MPTKSSIALAAIFLSACATTANIDTQTGYTIGSVNFTAQELAKCVTTEEIDEILSLDFNAFNNIGPQNKAQRSWTNVALKEGCEITAAKMNEVYADRLEQDPDAEIPAINYQTGEKIKKPNGETFRLPVDSAMGLINWHATQLYAAGGDYDTAIKRLEEAKKERNLGFYGEGTLAFLKHRRAIASDASEESKKQLAILRKNYDALRKQHGKDEPNVLALASLVNCSELDYGEAYKSGECRSKDPYESDTSSLQTLENPSSYSIDPSFITFRGIRYTI